ncbi:MAG: hypothetical protein ACRD3V_22840 [Vicinamibacteria bacterium]
MLEPLLDAHRHLGGQTVALGVVLTEAVALLEGRFDSWRTCPGTEPGCRDKNEVKAREAPARR